jgi:hypothetical protein
MKFDTFRSIAPEERYAQIQNAIEPNNTNALFEFWQASFDMGDEGIIIRLLIDRSKVHPNNTFVTKEGVLLYYKNWGTGRPIVFRHDWPLSADKWDSQMLYFLLKDYRVIAHDRRGTGVQLKLPMATIWIRMLLMPRSYTSI